MGEEQKSETKNGKILGKKRGIIGVAAAAVLAMIVGLTIYATPAGRIARQLDLGQKYLAEQDYEQAVIAFNKAIEIDPMDVDAYIGLAAAYEGLGDMERAAAALEQGWQITKSPEIKRQLVDAYLVQAKEKAGEQAYADGLAVFDRLLELDGENGEVINALSECLNGYLAVLMKEQKYDEIRTLAGKYADVAAGVDFNALLEQIRAIEEAARLEKEAVTKQGEDTEEISPAEEPKEASQETAQEPIVQETSVEEQPEEEQPEEEQTTTQEARQADTSGEVIVWKEKAIEQAVRKILGKPEGDIHKSEVAGITELVIWDNISDISDLESFINLTELFLVSSNISDISVLSGLTNLTNLDLALSNLSDISALSGLTNLTNLDLALTSISDVGALSGLTNLTNLDLESSNISDISALSGLTNLTDLNLESNNISNIGALSGLTNLTNLNLAFNNISDVSALSGLANLTELGLNGNNISDVSALSGLINLTELYLWNNPITDYSPVSFVPEYEN